jgi:outer membrane protein assembly factor BamB
MDFSTPAIGLNGTVYVVDSMYHSLLALDSQGEEKWLIDIENNYTVAQPVIGAGDTIYLCDEGGSITAVCEGGLDYTIDPDPTQGGSVYADSMIPENNKQQITLTFNVNIMENGDITDGISFKYMTDDQVLTEATIDYDIEDNKIHIFVTPAEGDYFNEGVLSIPHGFVTDESGSVMFEGCIIEYTAS